MADFAAFLGVSALVIVTPGQDTALTIRNTLRGRRKAGIATGIGVSAGQATWTLATSAGAAAILQASEVAFTAVRLAGSAYLVYLGAQALLAAVRGHRNAPPNGAPGEAPVLTTPTAFRQGLLSNLGNPKMALFFTSLLPQFAPVGEASFAAFLMLGLTFCTMTLAWLSIYAVAVDRAGDFLRRTSAGRWLEGVTGVALIALGLKLALDRR